MYAEKPKFGPEHYSAGTNIVEQGGVPDKFYIITNGEVEIIYRHPDGREEVINRQGAGEFFGEIGMINRSRRVATVRARTDVDVMAMDHRTFNDWLNSSMLSRDEINEVMRNRMTNVGDLELVELDSPGARKETPAVEPDIVHPEEAIEAFVNDPHASTGSQIFQPGEVIIHQGDKADRFYMIVDGYVEVLQTDEEGGESVVARLESGSYFGEIGLMEGARRVATVRALTQVNVMAFNRDTFSNWIAQSAYAQGEIRLTAHERQVQNLGDEDED